MIIKSFYPSPKKDKPKINQEEIKKEEPVIQETQKEEPVIVLSHKRKKKIEFEEQDDLAKLLADLKEQE